MNPSRRRFVFIGLAGAVTLYAARALQPATASAAALAREREDVVRGLIPALLDGALPEDQAARAAAIERTVTGVSQAVAGLPPNARDELATLFGLLAFGPVRILFAGIDSPWRDADVAQASAFLTHLRQSRLSLKRAAYDALHQLVLAAWYANPDNWSAIGYPGPPRLS